MVEATMAMSGNLGRVMLVAAACSGIATACGDTDDNDGNNHEGGAGSGGSSVQTGGARGNTGGAGVSGGAGGEITEAGPGGASSGGASGGASGGRLGAGGATAGGVTAAGETSVNGGAGAHGGMHASGGDTGGSGEAATSGAAGESGAGGTAGDCDARLPAGCPALSPAISIDLIDNLEDGDANILALSGRHGAWFATDSGAPGTRTPAGGSAFNPVAVDSSEARGLFVIRSRGSGYSWAVTGMNLNGGDDTYSLLSARGVALWAKGVGSLRVKVPTVLTSGTGPGLCTTNCEDHYGRSIQLTSGWRFYLVPFASMAQEGTGAAAAFDLSHAVNIQFDAGGADFDYWLDDVGLYSEL